MKPQPCSLQSLHRAGNLGGDGVHLALLQQQLDSAAITDLLLDRRPAKGRIGKYCRAGDNRVRAAIMSLVLNDSILDNHMQKFDTQQLACNKVAAVALVWDIRRILQWRPLGRRGHRRCVGLCDGRQCSQHSQELVYQSALTHGGQNIHFCATILTRVDATEVPDDLPDRSRRSQMVSPLVKHCHNAFLHCPLSAVTHSPS